MTKKDLLCGVIIGAAVGLLSQPVLTEKIISQIQSGAGSQISPLLLRAAVFAGFLLLAPIALFIGSLFGKILASLYQLTKFAAVGSLNSFVDLGVFNLSILILGYSPVGIVYAVFKTISFFAATTNSYFWNKHWTFGASNRANTMEVTKFFSIAIFGGLVLNVGVSTLLGSYVAAPGLLGSNGPDLWSRIVAPVIGFFAALFWNFFGYKFFVFGKKEQKIPANFQVQSNSETRVG
jgi:putative flippase GtrA